MKQVLVFFVILFSAFAQEERGGVVEATVSHDFSHAGFFAPVAKNLALDAQYFWTPRAGSQAMLGAGYILKAGRLKLVPAFYYVSESCHGGVRPWGCNDMAVGTGWEWQNGSWGTRGFVAQTLRSSELRFGLADPVQVFRRFHGDRLEFGLAALGEEEREEERSHFFAKAGLSGRYYFGEPAGEGPGRNYAEVTTFFGHGGPTVRLTVGRTF